MSYLLFIIAGVLVATGVGLGSFVDKTIFISVLGGFLVLPATIIFIISQIMEQPKSGEAV